MLLGEAQYVSKAMCREPKRDQLYQVILSLSLTKSSLHVHRPVFPLGQEHRRRGVDNFLSAVIAYPPGSQQHPHLDDDEQ